MRSRKLNDVSKSKNKRVFEIQPLDDKYQMTIREYYKGRSNFSFSPFNCMFKNIDFQVSAKKCSMDDFKQIFQSTIRNNNNFSYASDHHDNIFEMDTDPHVTKLNDKLSQLGVQPGFNSPGLFLLTDNTLFPLHVDGHNLGTLHGFISEEGQKLWVYLNMVNVDIIHKYMINSIDKRRVNDRRVNECAQFFVHRRFIIDPWLATKEIS